MNFKTVISLFLVLFVSFVYCENGAELLFHKKIVEGPVVGKELPIQFIIYNVGSEPAYDISFIDNDFSNAEFEFVSGSSEGKWETLAPNSQVQTNLTVIPKKSGIYSLTSTVLNYRKTQTSSEFTVSSAASYSGMYVESQADYEKRTSLLIKEWITFFVLCAGAIALPYSISTYYKKNYENGIKK
ncbi:translocon-associated protein subunit beta [Dictyostelium discoideum AX4]|uniref:Translocon-associated protein subunit beta n=1 Tax=Dictyostelium discoideum TaxID=44689 RepID=SSRB_DICDI|nr:translocon-associated protein subunit beta [Dictyostelium discoideum AX4]Q54VI6.2 RecName: Full=Translocon-associated protein subunit beta; Short=TRAP-beta; AltName: Full=Signal sequence receptor subunit beta; Short=SSR-beta; Flags: Precursor [Dictyostelium discoideum]EAL67383.2 translocon-associated protein subunit beta [Dictyostelium discoideum AX4]|eukprot:XP_641369.2 translocon-associated protein subunit beta [Dictyostelium discoideum AX4]